LEIGGRDQWLQNAKKARKYLKNMMKKLEALVPPEKN
jgi:hypothetical protein